MSLLSNSSRCTPSTLNGLFLALALLLAQQAAQLHALAHAQNELAQTHKSNPLSHPAEQCLAFHAIDSALLSTAPAQDFDLPQVERACWVPTQAQARALYSLPTRAPPRAV